MFLRRTVAAAIAALLALSTALLGTATSAETGQASSAPAEKATEPLTNLAHLDWLGDSVVPPRQAGHTTYRLAAEPDVGVLWTYAEPGPDGEFRRVGGGNYDPATDTWGQGAFNADDISRAAVVYLRHWRQTGATSSRDHAYELLRGLTYLQTVTGRNAGNVVLWMQPDGTLNPSADPVELPDPSDSDASYWLARTLWALGEGYAAFRTAHPKFAGFLRDRMNLAVDAVQRQVLDAYGTYRNADGRATPAWLIADGADATSEALLGLAPYVEAGGGRDARDALRKLADGVAIMSGGDAQHWPFGAVEQWTGSRSLWHAWGSQTSAGLAEAYGTLGNPRLARAALADTALFTPWMLTSGGPDQGRLPTPIGTAQIAYGADSRVQSLLATADATRTPGLRRLAGITAAWFFGANASGAPVYDQVTGRTFDGIESDGRVNRNSGAESTIHGLLSMLALDARPDVAALAKVANITERVGSTTVQAEDGELSGPARVVEPVSRWTGESEFGGRGFAALGDGGSVTIDVPAGEGRRLVMPVVDLQPGSSAVTRWSADGRSLGRVVSGDIGAQGITEAPGALLPVTLPRTVDAGAFELRAATRADSDDEARIDAVMLQPLVSRYVLSGGGRATALLHSAATGSQRATVQVPGTGRATVEVYDRDGRLRESRVSDDSRVRVTVLPSGFTVVRR